MYVSTCRGTYSRTLPDIERWRNAAMLARFADPFRSQRQCARSVDPVGAWPTWTTAWRTWANVPTAWLTRANVPAARWFSRRCGHSNDTEARHACSPHLRRP